MTKSDRYSSFSISHLPRDVTIIRVLSAESFFKYLKKEETNRRIYCSLADLRIALFEYIDGYYNSRRPHGSLGYLTPNEKDLAAF